MSAFLFGVSMIQLACTDGSSGSDKNNLEPKPKPKVIPRKEVPPPRAAPVSALTHQNVWIPN